MPFGGPAPTWAYTSTNVTSGSTTTQWYSWTNASNATTSTYGANASLNAYIQEGYQRAMQRALNRHQQEYAEMERDRAQGLGPIEPPPLPPTMKPAFPARARARARRLLRSLLTPDQWASYRAHRMFEQRGRSGEIYRVHRGRIANIEVPARGYRLCVHPDPRIEMPVEDVLAAQVLHLRTDEQGLRATANVHPGLRGPRG